MTHPGWRHTKDSQTATLSVGNRTVIVCSDPFIGWLWRQLRPSLTEWERCKTKEDAFLKAETWISAMEQH